MRNAREPHCVSVWCAALQEALQHHWRASMRGHVCGSREGDPSFHCVKAEMLLAVMKLQRRQLRCLVHSENLGNPACAIRPAHIRPEITRDAHEASSGCRVIERRLDCRCADCCISLRQLAYFDGEDVANVGLLQALGGRLGRRLGRGPLGRVGVHARNILGVLLVRRIASAQRVE